MMMPGESKRRNAIRRSIYGFAIALMLAGSFGRSGQAASMSELVGNWFSETTEDKNKVVDGKPYTIRRELLINRADGTKSNIQRYYSGARLVTEVITTFKWGVNDNLYWAECQTVLYKGAATPCSDRYEYELISVSAQQIQYKSRKTGVTYVSRRVRDNYRLP